MANAKEELMIQLKQLVIKKGRSIPIKCATISGGTSHWYHDEYVKNKMDINLREGHSIGEYEEFLHKLDFEYDNGYGGQVLHGTVWLTEENTWLERGEYDGSEWWEYKECPQIPDKLKTN
jgi:hypothetical protein